MGRRTCRQAARAQQSTGPGFQSRLPAMWGGRRGASQENEAAALQAAAVAAAAAAAAAEAAGVSDVEEVEFDADAESDSDVESLAFGKRQRHTAARQRGAHGGGARRQSAS